MSLLKFRTASFWGRVVRVALLLNLVCLFACGSSLLAQAQLHSGKLISPPHRGRIAPVSSAVWGWGNNYFGQLGIGSNGYSDVPASVSGLSGVVATAGGFAHTLALLQNGTVMAWDPTITGSLATARPPIAALLFRSRACLVSPPLLRERVLVWP